jgi:hypothetical protein
MFLYFVGLTVWVLIPDWLNHKLKCTTFVRRLVEAATPEGVRAVPRLCIILFTGICITTGEISLKILSQGIRKVLGLSTPIAIRLVELIII